MVGEIVKRVFLWKDQYYVDFRELPDDGLSAAVREVTKFIAQHGGLVEPDVSSMERNMRNELTKREQK